MKDIFAKINFKVDDNNDVTVNLRTNATDEELKRWIKYLYENLDKAERA